MDLKSILNDLEIPINSFENYDMDLIKKNYRYLIKKYHPDNASNDIEKEYNTRKMSIINKAMDRLKLLIENEEIIIKQKSEVKQNYDVFELINKLNKLKVLVKSKQKSITNLNLIKSINESLEYLEEVKEIISIYIERSEKYDYWNFINYVDILYCYYSETLNINYNYELNIKYKFNNNHLIEEKQNISLLHRKLLYIKIKELIILFKELENNKIDYKNYMKKYNDICNFIEEIDNKIFNIKWYIELDNIDKNKLKERINKLDR